MRIQVPLMLLCLPALAAPSPEPESRPLYARVGAMLPQEGFRAFLGGKSAAPLLEVGYTFQDGRPVSFSAHLDAFDARGRAIPEFAGLRQDLKGLRAGVDARYRTPWPVLKLYAGFTLGVFDGERAQAGAVPNYDDPKHPIAVPSASMDETRPKFGYRVGVEVAHGPAWAITLDYNASEWYSRSQDSTRMPDSGPYRIHGVNPVNPTWLGLSVQYRWARFF